MATFDPRVLAARPAPTFRVQLARSSAAAFMLLAAALVALLLIEPPGMHIFLWQLGLI